MTYQFEFRAFLSVWAEDEQIARDIADGHCAAYENNPDGVRLSLDDGTAEVVDEGVQS